MVEIKDHLKCVVRCNQRRRRRRLIYLGRPRAHSPNSDRSSSTSLSPGGARLCFDDLTKLCGTMIFSRAKIETIDLMDIWNSACGGEERMAAYCDSRLHRKFCKNCPIFGLFRIRSFGLRLATSFFSSKIKSIQTSQKFSK